MNETQRRWWQAPFRRLGLVELAVAATLVLLLAHSVQYAFLTDDAYISFRYARNLSEGHGLVFNPGHERVEGYTNFLWVMVLAGFSAVGLHPEVVSHGLTLGLTVVLWVLVVWFVYRHAPQGPQRWLLLVAPLLLAVARSVAVWSTSGLETRLFEVLILAAALRMVVEVESELAGRARWYWSSVLFALATLTRPDGLLISGAAFLVAALHLGAHRRLSYYPFIRRVAVYVVIVGAHLSFRTMYYGQWLPNTYYAKVGGKTWWNMGLIYAGMFFLEYAAYLWLPLIAAAVVAYCRRKRTLVPKLFGAIIIPHFIYIIAIGGDHFEYRPLTMYFPFIFILMYEGARWFARSRLRGALTAAYLVLVVAGLVAIPLYTHSLFPDFYTPSSPLLVHRMEPGEHPVFALPVLRQLVGGYRWLLAQATSSFVGIRQEEHRQFLATAVPQGRRLRRLVESGLLPPDAYVAMDCVGAIPYYSRLRVLDRLGLTDAGIAHGEFKEGPRLMAHAKRAKTDYARDVGVDLWTLDNVHPTLHISDQHWPRHLNLAHRAPELALYVAELREGYYLFVLPCQGIDHARRRFPKLNFRHLGNPRVAMDIVDRAMAFHRRRIRDHPDDYVSKRVLAELLDVIGQSAQAVKLYEQAVRQAPHDLHSWRGLSRAYIHVGEHDKALAATRRGIEIARAEANSQIVEYLQAREKQLEGRIPLPRRR